MKLPRFTYVGAAATILLCAIILVSTPRTRAQEFDGNFGVGIPEVFLPRYLAFRTAQVAGGSPDVMRVKLGYVKGLSRSFVSMVGEASINLGSGAFSVNLSGLTPFQTYTVWLVNQTDGDPPLDTVAGLVTFLATGPTALLNGVLPVTLPLGFAIDRVVVTKGIVWGAEPLGAGLVNVFQKIFFRRLSLLNESTGELMFDETTSAPARFALVPALEFETSGGSSGRGVNMDQLISKGAQLFFEETFKGNGRTCGSCHPAENNFTIDPPFIATLPANDPLFVAEFNPALAQLERPPLMRQFGLILENLDGLDDPTNKFVMRGVPHTLGMPVSLQQDPSQQPAPAEMTGWSGDGSPGTGSLREFAIGAVTQHFTKRLNRVAGTDFRLPRNRELDAMEAFQLSLGRDRDFNLANTTFQDPNVETGKQLFVNGNPDPSQGGGRCAVCHDNGGALLVTAGTNNNFNTNVEDVPHPARMVQNFPIDGGFGRTDNGDGTFGNRAFNTASVVEAADTPPFFHNNVVTTLRGVVDFYTGPEFNNPRPLLLQFRFDETQRNQITNFMRALNTLQNVDVATRELREILANRRDPRREQDTRLETAFEDTQDGITVLNQGGIFPSAVTKLTEARNLISQALQTGNAAQRRSLVQQAIGKLGQARALVASS